MNNENGTKVIFLHGFHPLIEGKNYRIRLPGQGEKSVIQVVKVTFNTCKMRNAAGVMIPMPQTQITYK